MLSNVLEILLMTNLVFFSVSNIQWHLCCYVLLLHTDHIRGRESHAFLPIWLEGNSSGHEARLWTAGHQSPVIKLCCCLSLEMSCPISKAELHNTTTRTVMANMANNSIHTLRIWNMKSNQRKSSTSFCLFHEKPILERILEYKDHTHPHPFATPHTAIQLENTVFPFYILNGSLKIHFCSEIIKSGWEHGLQNVEWGVWFPWIDVSV